MVYMFRINLTFWDELAHVASLHVEKGNQIYVSGRVVSDTVENDDGKQQTYYKVIHFVFYYGIAPLCVSVLSDFNCVKRL